MRFTAAVLLSSALLAFGPVALQAQAQTADRPRDRETQPPAGVGNIPPVLDIVEVVGCLQSAPNDMWILTNSTAPALQRRPTTTPEAVKAAASKPLGTQKFRLMNIGVFNPAAHQGHKMVVRGLLIKDAKDPRINTMSFQMVDAACAK